MAEKDKAELDDHAVDDCDARLVAFKIGAHPIGPESRRHLHQDVLTRFWALVKQYGVPFNLSATLTTIAWGTLDNDRRRRERAAQHDRASRHDPMGAGWLAEPSAHFLLLLNEAAALLPTAPRAYAGLRAMFEQFPADYTAWLRRGGVP
jgi:DNA-directed RNA polymerase specialized sigma24 family protein